jgi:uncharacterized membrane protein
MHSIFLADAGGFYFPPLHPILVHFTVVLIPLSFFCDALGAWLRKEGLRAAGWWSLLAVALLTPLTVVFGWLWMDSMGDVQHWAMPWHMWIGVGLGIALIPLTIWRGWRYWKGRGPGYVYLLPAAIVLFALLVQGDLGGAMSLGSGIVFKTDAPLITRPAQSSPNSPVQWKDYLEIKK